MGLKISSTFSTAGSPGFSLEPPSNSKRQAGSFVRCSLMAVSAAVVLSCGARELKAQYPYALAPYAGNPYPQQYAMPQQAYPASPYQPYSYNSQPYPQSPYTQQPYQATPQPYSQPYAQQGYSQPAGVQPLNTQQLEQLVAPIALYPDTLVAQVLAASTYPGQVQDADRWLQVQGNASPYEIAGGADVQSWDPSVKALTAFPQVLAQLDQNIQWTTDLAMPITISHRMCCRPCR